MPIRILLADDHQLIREGLVALMKTQVGIAVVGQARNGREAVELASELMPDVVVMDIAMPDLNGIEATRRILGNHSRCKIIAISARSDRQSVNEMLKAGAKAYVTKESAFEELAAAIRSVVEGKVVLSPHIADCVAVEYLYGTSSEPSRDAYSLLTSREREILQLVAEGQATKEIAANLDVSIKTVETHRRQVMKKLNLHGVAELTKYAIREGLASLDIKPNM
jgi:DNA-binding NarL/FixJ family response regulator